MDDGKALASSEDVEMFEVAWLKGEDAGNGGDGRKRDGIYLMRLTNAVMLIVFRCWLG